MKQLYSLFIVLNVVRLFNHFIYRLFTNDVIAYDKGCGLIGGKYL